MIEKYQRGSFVGPGILPGSGGRPNEIGTGKKYKKFLTFFSDNSIVI